MSNRTAQAAKAIRAAWANEQQLVSDGRGTRDWTPEQQEDILSRGKAYDEDGKAFEGHHMKSAENYPDHQGDPGNIQFLSRQEHLAAHGGCFQHPTNGMFNPITGETCGFDGEGYVPCEIIELSSPISEAREKASSQHDQDNESQEVERSESNESDCIKSDVEDVSGGTQLKNADDSPSHPQKTKRDFIRRRVGRIGKSVKRIPYNVRSFIDENSEVLRPLFNDVIKPAIGIAIAAGVERAISSIGTSTSKSGMGTDRVDRNAWVEIANDIPESRPAGIDRASPREHPVSGYTRQQNGKTVHVRSYTRGHNSDG